MFQLFAACMFIRKTRNNNDWMILESFPISTATCVKKYNQNVIVYCCVKGCIEDLYKIVPKSSLFFQFNDDLIKNIEKYQNFLFISNSRYWKKKLKPAIFLPIIVKSYQNIKISSSSKFLIIFAALFRKLAV